MRLLLLVLCLGALAAPARALESAAVTSERAVATLVTDTDRVTSGKPFLAGLRLRLSPGWHTYWQNPGDAGVAPELAFDFTRGMAGSAVEWPAPEVIAEGPLTTFAYQGEVLLPSAITPGPNPALRLHATWLVCKNICVPEEGDFALDLPAGDPAPSAEAPLFAAAAARAPVPSPYAAQFAPDGTLTLATGQALAASVRQAEFFPVGRGIGFARPQPFSVKDGALSLKLATVTGFDAGSEVTGVLVLHDAKGGLTALSIEATPGGPVTGTAMAETIPEMLLLALVGGLILNLMPCVFPVLAMKAMSIARMSGHDRGAVRAHALSYTAGVVLAFMALGGGLLLLRVAGQAAGWGFQFQSPVFVAAMAWLLFSIGLNLSGVFAIDGGVAGAGQSLAGRGGHAGSFFTGLLAVLVATPCTAPFMGAAIAGALVAPAAVTLLVFATMGAGLALPYALLAVAPALARSLPRPGAWMDLLKEILAFPMYAAVVWLLWVMSQEAGSDGVLAVAGGLALLAFAGWALGRAQRGAGFGRRLGQAAAVAGLVAAGLLLPGITPMQATERGSSSEATEPFTAARLAELRAQNRPVFVNMTAAWCVSCLVNERVALSTQAVKDAFASRGVAYLKGDWTQQDAAISAFLREHSRDGVPLYVFYGPGQAPKILPQVLTPGIVLDSLGGAKT